MSCDLGRLRLAIDAAQAERGAEHRFQMRIHGHQVEEPPPPDQTDEEMVASARNVMAMFRRRAVDPDDDD
ncbi:hypothetical protein [Aureimonas sp. AU12]|uniref:hypothetical protein n=1 Tax=Aureimonas sp. AU12 TaxID=1638161 RepID=UPI000784BAC4|nr:hypothetical protein [Aureimonas sp. AU12]